MLTNGFSIDSDLEIFYVATIVSQPRCCTAGTAACGKKRVLPGSKLQEHKPCTREELFPWNQLLLMTDQNFHCNLLLMGTLEGNIGHA